MLATVGLTDFGGVVMSARPASIRKIIPVERGDRNRAGPGYARKMTEALRSLGVETDLSDA
ncbi:MAG TPA: hypothetical protein VHC00_19935 [Rhizobiaceae bacterium]|nr:hypothetical protein [Rhizobiaceae bacterium]